MWKTILKEKMLIPGVVAIDRLLEPHYAKDGRGPVICFEDKGYVEIWTFC